MTEQMSLTLDRARGESAAEACTSKATEVAQFDSEGAARFIRGYLVRHGNTAGEILTEQAIAHGFHVHDRRAYGSVYAKLNRANLIRCVGFCMRKHGNGTAGGRVWQAVL